MGELDGGVRRGGWTGGRDEAQKVGRTGCQIPAFLCFNSCNFLFYNCISMKGKFLKIIRTMPFLVLTVILIRTWYIFGSTEYAASTKHYAALALMIANLPLYFIRFRMALYFTGAILLFTTFNLLAFFPDIEYSSFGIGPIHTPDLQFWALLLCILFWAINWSFLRQKDPTAQSK